MYVEILEENKTPKIKLKILSIDKNWTPLNVPGLEKIFIDQDKLCLPVDAEKYMLMWCAIVEKAYSKTSRAVHKVAKKLGTFFKGKKEEKKSDKTENLEDLKAPKVLSRGSMSTVAIQAMERFYKVYNFFFMGDNKIKVPASIIKAKKTIDKYNSDFNANTSDIVTANASYALKALKIQPLQGVKLCLKDDDTYVNFLNGIFNYVRDNEKALGYKVKVSVDNKNIEGELYKNCNNVLKAVNEKSNNSIKGAYFTVDDKDKDEKAIEMTNLEKKVGERIKKLRHNMKKINSAVENLNNMRGIQTFNKILKKINEKNPWYTDKYLSNIRNMLSIPDKIKDNLNKLEKTSSQYKMVVKFGAKLQSRDNKTKSGLPPHTTIGTLNQFVEHIKEFNKMSVDIEKILCNKCTCANVVNENIQNYIDRSKFIKDTCVTLLKIKTNIPSDTKDEPDRISQLSTIDAYLEDLEENYLRPSYDFIAQFKNIMNDINLTYCEDNSIVGWIKYLNGKLLELQTFLTPLQTILGIAKIV